MPEGGGGGGGVGDGGGGGAVDGLAVGPDDGELVRCGDAAAEADGEWPGISGEWAVGECEPDEPLDGVPRGDPEPIGEPAVLGDALVATAPGV